MQRTSDLSTYLGVYSLKGQPSSNEDDDPIIRDVRLTISSGKCGPVIKEICYGSRNGVFSVVFKGELYNLADLAKEMDIPTGEREGVDVAELCCMLYQRYGADFVGRLNGLFSLVLRDQNEDVLIVAVDRFGLAKPLFYHLDGRVLRFGPHLKTLLLDRSLTREVDTVSLALFLKYAYIPSPRTIVDKVRKLGPGERIVCRGEEFKIDRYIDFQCQQRHLEVEDAVSRYTDLLAGSLTKRLADLNDGKVGVFLSGGLDSSANVAFVSHLAKVPVEAFGIGFEDMKVDERPFARATAEHYGIPFHDYVFRGDEIEDLPAMLWYLEEPFLENGLFLTYAGFKSLGPGVGTVITGNCTDQLFGTGGFTGGLPIAVRYLTDKAHMGPLMKILHACTVNPMFYQDNLLFKVKVMLDRVYDFNEWFFWGFDNRQLREMCSFPINNADLHVFENNISARPATLSDYYQFSVIHQDLEHYACQNVLVKTHRMSEMFGVRARDPYLDYDLVDFILGLDLGLKRHGSLKDFIYRRTKTKYLHRLAVKKLLPDKILSKPKQGGAILMTMLLGDNCRRKRIFDYVRNSAVIREYMKMPHVKSLLDRYDYLLGKEVYWQGYHDAVANQILYLLTFSLWYDIILHNRTSDIPKQQLSNML